MTVYTIFAAGGRELAKFTSLEEAAIEMLTQDGHRFESGRSKIDIDFSSRIDRRDPATSSNGSLMPQPRRRACIAVLWPIVA